MEKVNNKCLIIGNGPSVNSIDFNSLKETPGVSTLCCNRIDLLIKEENWYPDYYFCFKSEVDENWKNSIQYVCRHKNIKCFLSKEFKSFLSNTSNVTFVKNLKEHYRHSPIPDNLFETSFDECQFKSYSATVPLFQYCFSRDVKTIGIIGQDGYIYNEGKNHFNDSYGYEALNFKKSNDRIVLLHSAIQKHCRKNNIRIYNLTKESIIKNHSFLSFKEFLNL
jgi:hypothetical protein